MADSTQQDAAVRIISWNVASWATAVAKIRETYGKTVQTTTSHDGLSTFLDLTNVTILCLQETKVTHKRVMSEPFVCGASDSLRPGGATTPIAGWETFWTTSVKAPGFNGVATYAKLGMTLFADPRPLRVGDLDDEGRCLLTIHKRFAIFNIYAPFSRDVERHAFKKRFYIALLQAIARVRAEYSIDDMGAEQGSPMRSIPIPIILLGDFNLVRHQQDTHWTKWGIPLDYLSFLRIDEHAEWWTEGTTPRCPVETEEDVKSLIQTRSVHSFENVENPIDRHHTVLRLAPYLKPYIDSGVLSIAAHIYNRFHDNTQVKMELTDEERSYLKVKPTTLPQAMRLIDLCPKICGESFYDSVPLMTSNGLFDSCERDAMFGAQQEVARAHILATLNQNGLNDSKKELEELLAAANIPLNPPLTVKHNTAICVLVLLTGVCCSDPYLRQTVFGSLLNDSYPLIPVDESVVALKNQLPLLVDAVSCCYPNVSNSFTCWDQSRNSRYQNFGSRIDYILVDKTVCGSKATVGHPAALFLYWDASLSPAYGGLVGSNPTPAEKLAHTVAMRSIACAEGLYPQAPPTGEGMPPPTLAGREATFVPAHKLASFAAYCAQYMAASGEHKPALSEFIAYVRGNFVELLRTGPFSTPSQYSDHIGVAVAFSRLYVRDLFIPTKREREGNTIGSQPTTIYPINVSKIASLEERDKLFPSLWDTTKACSYRVVQQTLASMFSRMAKDKAPTGSTISSAPTANSRARAPPTVGRSDIVVEDDEPATKKGRAEVINID